MANRLANATSPYLLQHAENPVDWWEWGSEAFEEARRRDVPLLVSVGYAACHWCHVMAHESFENPVTASFMNAHFVNVKVDREERPDVDAVYMQATTAMTGQGGWPMTVVVNHEGEPFFAGTYFPDSPRHGQPAFGQVLQALAGAWRDRRDEIARVAGDVSQHLRDQVLAAGGEPLDEQVLAGAVDQLAADFDPEAAGFGSGGSWAPKFPPSMVLEFLLRHAARVSTGSTGRGEVSTGSGRRSTGSTGRGEVPSTGSGPREGGSTGRGGAQDMVDATCRAMARGGIYDQLGGGFARYSVDRGWVVPHFEKMLYDNAQLLGLYARWWRQSGDPLGARVAHETAGFLIDELGTAEGGFASALDADSEGEEGRFYVWTPGQLREVLGEQDAAWAADLLHVTDAGTFEGGASTLQLLRDPDDPERWERVRARLLEARSHRVRPARDDKVVAAWNGLAIASLAEAGRILETPAYVEAARAAAQLLRDVHLDGGRLLRVSRDGRAGRHAAVLEDLGCVATGFLALHRATGEATWLELAGGLVDDALERFGADDGGFYDTAVDAEALVSRPRDPSDNASPSGHSAMVHALLSYAAVTGSGRHRGAAEAALRSVRVLAERVPRFAGWSLAAAEAALAGPLEVAVIGDRQDPRRAELERVAWAAVSPGLVVVADAPGRSDVPLLEGRGPVDGTPAAYVCRQLVCERPVTTPEQLRSLLAGT